MAGGIAENRVSRGYDRLSDRAVKSFVAKARAGTSTIGKLSDGGGLYLTLTPAGTAVWRVKYRIDGKERVFAAGIYPDVSLAAAREQRAEVKAHLRSGRDPVQSRALERHAATLSTNSTFSSVASSWLDKQKRGWSGIHYAKSERGLKRDVLPIIGELPIDQITSAMVANVVEKVAARGAEETAGRILQHISGIFRLARSRGLLHENVAVDVREVLPRRKRRTGRPALIVFDELRDVLRRADLAPVSPSVRLANRLIAFSAQRIGDVVAATWDQFDLESDAPTWTIPREQMKVRDRDGDHRVPLGPTIAGELLAWRKATGGKGVVFPSPSGKRSFVGREAIEKLYSEVLELDGRHSPHSWRTAFSTLSREVGDFDRDVVELALDHISDSRVIRAYNRAQRFDQRVRLARWWDAQLYGEAVRQL
jgi:integrase